MLKTAFRAFSRLIVPVRHTRAEPGKHRQLQFDRLVFRPLALVTIASLAGFATTPAAAAPSTQTDVTRDTNRTCAARYHASLEALSTDEIQRLKAGLDALVNPSRDRSTTWTFWSAKPQRRWRRRDKIGRVTPRLRRGRVCVDERWTRRGKLQCRRWATATPERVARLSRWVPRRNPRPKRTERRQIKFLNDTVANAGALSAFKEGGRFYWLIRRYVIDLEAYLTQPPSAGICAGVPTLVSFYIEQFEPFDDRIKFVASLESAANKRIRAQARVIDKQNAKARRAAKAAAEKERRDREARVARGETPVLEATAQTPADDPWANVRSPLDFDLDRRVDAIKAFMQGLPPLVDPDSAPPDTEVTTLEDARLALDAERTTPISKARHDAIVRAMRAIETRAIAQETKAIYVDYRRVVTDALDRIQDRHSRACQCGSASN